MTTDSIRFFNLAMELLQPQNLKSRIETILAVVMYNLNQAIASEKSSIFLSDVLGQQLISFSSLDLERGEVRIPLSFGVTGWVFENRKSAIVDDAYNDSRFYCGVDAVTGFRTRNIICTPLIDHKNCCLGTLQSMNKINGSFGIDDLGVIALIAHLAATALSNWEDPQHRTTHENWTFQIV